VIDEVLVPRAPDRAVRAQPVARNKRCTSCLAQRRGRKEKNAVSKVRNCWPLLRIRDFYPGSWFWSIPDPGSSIPDPKAGTLQRGVENKFLVTFYVATNITK